MILRAFQNPRKNLTDRSADCETFKDNLGPPTNLLLFDVKLNPLFHWSKEMVNRYDSYLDNKTLIIYLNILVIHISHLYSLLFYLSKNFFWFTIWLNWSAGFCDWAGLRSYLSGLLY